MKNFIELTKPNGYVFMANINYIVRVEDMQGEKPNENTYIFGLSNNGGSYVRECYDQIITLIKNAQNESTNQ